MDRKFVNAIALALATAVLPSQAQDSGPLQPDQLFDRVAPSVWLVETFDANRKPVATGSSVVIGPGRLITNCHVLARSRHVVVARENVSYGAELEFQDPERDLCQLRVANFTAPSVDITGAEAMRIGSRVYAIGNPKGLEQTISDGLLSGMRRRQNGDVHLQITVPISPGSSGGGLFDSRGRLIGITTYALRDSQNINFALPASWIAEIPQRIQAAALRPSPSAVAASASAPGRGQVFEYHLRDNLTSSVRQVVYRLDRTDGDRLFFNQGTRIEKAGGAVVSMTSPIGGDFDLAMPPGGWISEEPKPGASWSADYRHGSAGQLVALRWRAQVLGEGTMRFKDADLRVVRVEFSGFTERNSGATNNPPARYKAVAAYAPDLGRIVRFEVRTRGGVGGGAFVIDELLTLVDIRSE